MKTMSVRVPHGDPLAAELRRLGDRCRATAIQEGDVLGRALRVQRRIHIGGGETVSVEPCASDHRAASQAAGVAMTEFWRVYAAMALAERRQARRIDFEVSTDTTSELPEMSRHEGFARRPAIEAFLMGISAQPCENFHTTPASPAL